MVAWLGWLLQVLRGGTGEIRPVSLSLSSLSGETAEEIDQIGRLCLRHLLAQGRAV